MTRARALAIYRCTREIVRMPACDSSPPPRVLVVLHQERSSAGRIGRLLAEQGIEIDCRRPCYGDPLPETMADHAGAIVLGGPMSANDGDAYIRREIDWIRVPLGENKPFLGICLGAQMLARCLGARVYAHDDGAAEIGYYPVAPTRHGRDLCAAAFPEHVYQWHCEGFDLPAGATLLASSETFEVQACAYGAGAYGLQFHPEVTYAMICRWLTRAHDRMNARGARPPHDHRADWYQHDAAVDRWTRAFLRKWLAAKPA